MITDGLKEKNYSIFLKKLEELGINIEKLENKYGEQLKNGTYSISKEHGLAYEGSLLNVVLRKLTPFALKTNEILPEGVKVEDTKKIIKVCLIQHLAKVLMFTKNENEWEVTKLGKLFTYAPTKMAMRLGVRSVALAMDLGIVLDEEEIEAITVIDKEGSDDIKCYARPLATVIRIANELVTTESIFEKKD